MRKYLSSGFNQHHKAGAGFTLVELLIVIALLGVIATIVIAAINPIEQSNRARDAQFKSDASQLLSAIERDYTTRNDYPWVGAGGAASSDVAYGFLSAHDGRVGICAWSGSATDCATDGELITDLELKTAFRSRNFVTDVGTDGSKHLFVGKAGTAGASVYACWQPLSKSNRDAACTNGKVYTLSTTTGVRTGVPLATCNAAGAWAVAANTKGDPATSWFVCVPE